MADDITGDAADSSGFDFNSLLSTVAGAAPGVVKALTGTPATPAAAAVKGTPTSAAAATGSTWTKYLPWAIGGAVVVAIILFFRRGK